MLFKVILLALTAALPVLANQGYVLPYTGVASTTQFILGNELSSGTACGMSALPNGRHTSGGQGGGPGYLYAAINQLAFGANPSIPGGGGPGAACGLCYWITPVSDSGVPLHDNALKFMIIDECPAKGSKNCGTCSTSQKNVFGHTWHFDIAVDAMSTEQYDQFFRGVTYGSDWKETWFERTDCGPENPRPPTKSWGCVTDCHNNPVGTVCEGFTPEF